VFCDSLLHCHLCITTHFSHTILLSSFAVSFRGFHRRCTYRLTTQALVFVRRYGLPVGVIVLVSALEDPPSDTAAGEQDTLPFRQTLHTQGATHSSPPGYNAGPDPLGGLSTSPVVAVPSSVTFVKVEEGTDPVQPSTGSTSTYSSKSADNATNGHGIDPDSSSSAAVSGPKRPPGFTLENDRPHQRIKQEGV
jgi:hypothetical protein